MIHRCDYQPITMELCFEVASAQEILDFEAKKTKLIRQGYAIINVTKTQKESRDIIIFYLEHENNLSENPPQSSNSYDS